MRKKRSGVSFLQNQWQALCATETASRTALDGQRLRHLHPALQRRLLRLAIERLQGNLQGIYGRHLEALRKLVAHGTPHRSIQLPRGLRAMIEGEFLVLSAETRESPPPAGPEFTLTMNGPGHYRFSSFALSLIIRDPPGAADTRPFPNARHIAWLDADRIKWPLYLRSWQEGDRFCPLGLGGTKKLQDFFVDVKVPGGTPPRAAPLRSGKDLLGPGLPFGRPGKGDSSNQADTYHRKIHGTLKPAPIAPRGLTPHHRLPITRHSSI